MSTEKTEGLVIRQADFSESSRVVTLFTKDFGKIAVVAHGAKRLKSSFEAALDLLTVCNIVFIRKSSSSLDILTEAQLKYRFKAKDRDLNGLYAGYYVAELLNGLTEEYDPHPQLYGEAIQILERLSEGQQWQRCLLRFELIVLRETGHLPGFDYCVLCGELVEPSGRMKFSDSHGGILCPQCETQKTNGTIESHSIQGGTLAVLQCLLSDSEQVWSRLNISSQQLRDLRDILNPSIAQALGRRPQMLSFLKFSSS